MIIKEKNHVGETIGYKKKNSEDFSRRIISRDR